MQLACPKCGTREVRVSHRQGLFEAIKGFLGVYPLRCRRCRHRWLTSAWAGGAWKFARCPRCYRQELTTWSEQYYHPDRWTVMLLRLGAIPYRCAACRCNFASFKRCKERFSWRHETKGDQPALRGESEITVVSGPSASANGALPGTRSRSAVESLVEPKSQGAERRVSVQPLSSGIDSPAAVRTPEAEPMVPEPDDEEMHEPYL